MSSSQLYFFISEHAESKLNHAQIFMTYILITYILYTSSFTIEMVAQFIFWSQKSYNTS